jgi:hypothetical protein
MDLGLAATQLLVIAYSQDANTVACIAIVLRVMIVTVISMIIVFVSFIKLMQFIALP